MLQFLRKYSILFLVVLISSASYGQENVTKGKLFYYGYMEAIAVNKLKLYITFSDKKQADTKNASIVVSVPGKLWDKGYTVKNHNFLEIDIPEVHSYVNTDDYLDNRTVKVISSEDIEVRIAVTSNSSMDATTVIPIKHIEKAPSYLVSAPNGSNVNRSQVLLVAPEKDTKVEIIPSVDLLSGKKANVPYTITMLAHGTYQFNAEGTESLSGTSIKVIDGCQKLVVFAGSECSNVSLSPSCSSCDQLLTQLTPISTYFNKYVLIPFNNTTAGNHYEIVSGENNNDVFLDGTLLTALNKGESARYEDVLQKTSILSSTKSMQVTQYMKSGSCLGETNGKGDPAMLNLSGFSTNTRSLSIKAPHTTNVRTHWISVITETANISSFKFDNAVVTSSNFSALQAGSLYSIAHFSVDDDIHFLDSDSGFYAVGYGYGLSESYAYFITKEFKEAPYAFNLDVSDLCIGNKPIEFRVNGDSLINVFWDFGNKKDTGVRTSHLPNRDSLTQKVTVIIQNKNNACPLDTIIKEYKLLKAPQIDLGPSDTTLCIGDRISFSVAQPGATYLWSNGSKSDNYFTTKEENIRVQVTGINGCTSYDSINVKVKPCEDSSTFIPNVMTPNGDGLNDEFYVSHFGYASAEGKIINRWGQKFTSLIYPKMGIGMANSTILEACVQLVPISMSLNLKNQKVKAIG